MNCYEMKISEKEYQDRLFEELILKGETKCNTT